MTKIIRLLDLVYGLNMTLFEVVENFISLRAPNSQKSYRAIFKEWCAHFNTSYGSRGAAGAIRKASQVDVIQFLNAQRKKKGYQTPKNSNLSQGTVFRKFTILRAIYDFLVTESYLETNPFSKTLINKPNQTGEKRPSTLIPFESVKKMLEIAKYDNPKDAAILSLLFGGGLRRSEVATLTLGDIDQQTDHIRLRLRETKSGHTQYQTLPDWASQAVKAYTIHRYNSGCTDENLLIPGRGEKQIDGKTIARIFKRYAKRAGVKGRVSPHSARATAITKLFTDREDPVAIQEFARHSSLLVTQRYDLRESLGESIAKKLKFLFIFSLAGMMKIMYEAT